MTTLVLIGPHGAGKTTLGHALADALGWPFHGEIGRALAEAGDAGRDASDRPERFDARVIAAELLRDVAFGGGSRIVETWHLGNLAYATTRSPIVAAAARPIVRGAVSATPDVVVLPVTARPEVLAERMSEPGDPSAMQRFFAEVARRAKGLANAWGLPVWKQLDTSRADPAHLVSLVLRAVDDSRDWDHRYRAAIAGRVEASDSVARDASCRSPTPRSHRSSTAHTRAEKMRGG